MLRTPRLLPGRFQLLEKILLDFTSGALARGPGPGNNVGWAQQR